MAALTAVDGVRVGHATDAEAETGCTVVLGPFRAACDVRGLATGTRELETLSPLHLVGEADALLLTGGSAFGLAAADGVVDWLREHDAGYDAGVARVPIVPAAVIFDLGIGASGRRPDAAMGRAACEAATDGPVVEGRAGAGAGATVGNLRGMAGAMRGGVGSWAVEGPDCMVGALAVVNAFGDVLDGRGGILAGARDDAGEFVDSARALIDGARAGPFRMPERGERPADDGADADRAGGGGAAADRASGRPGTNTTLAVVATDAPLTRTALQTVARAAGTGVVRRVSPVHTPFDGDVTFAVSTAPEAELVEPPMLMMLGVLAAHALERAIERAVTKANE